MRLLEREYYKIVDIAKELECTPDDLIHWAAHGKIRLGMLVSISLGFDDKSAGYRFFESNKFNSEIDAVFVDYAGFIYLFPDHFRELEVSGETVVTSFELITGEGVLIFPVTLYDHDKKSFQIPSYERLTTALTYIHRSDLESLLKQGLHNKTKTSELTSTEETTYLNIIGGLLSLLTDGAEAPGRAKKPTYVYENAIISDLLERFPGKQGIAKRTLEGKFPKAKESLKKS